MFHVLTRRRFVSVSLRLTAVAIAVWLGFSLSVSAIAQAQPDIAVIVNPAVTVDNLTISDLRRILTGDREFWTGSGRVTIFIRAPIARERDVVVREICDMTEAQFRQHWIGKVFRAETPSGPKIVYSADSTVEQVSRTPGAIGLVVSPVTAKNVKILKIDGRLPGQSGYRLR